MSGELDPSTKKSYGLALPEGRLSCLPQYHASGYGARRGRSSEDCHFAYLSRSQYEVLWYRDSAHALALGMVRG